MKKKLNLDKKKYKNCSIPSSTKSEFSDYYIPKGGYT